MSDSAYIEWGDVTITEELDIIHDANGAVVSSSSSWIAEFEGHIYNSGLLPNNTLPIISFSRSGRTADEAAFNLFNAAMEQGWEVR